MRSDNQRERESVIKEAETWLRTPHHNGARLKGVGVDCGQFPIAVYSALGFIPTIETGTYSAQFHLHRDREWYLEIVSSFGRELPEGDLPQPGDFALYKIGRIYSHGAIVVKWPTIIHAYVGCGVCFDDGTQHFMADKKVKFFTLWE